MPPKPPPPPPNVSTPRRRHRGAASSRSKSAAKELSSPHRPLRPSRKRSTRRHHRRHKPTPSSAFPARRRRRTTRPRAILRPRQGRLRESSRPRPTSSDIDHGAITGATSQEALRRAHSSFHPLPGATRTTPTVHRPVPPSPPRAGRWSAVKDIRQHRSRTREIRRVLVWGPPPRSA